jgi:hypothetical protein
MVTIAGGILLALAILALGYVLAKLFMAGLVAGLAWLLLKWTAKLALVLLPLALIVSMGSLPGIWKDVAALTAMGLLLYLDAEYN